MRFVAEKRLALTCGATLCLKHKSTESPNTLKITLTKQPHLPSPVKKFFALWDEIIGSIRFYPGALTPKPEPQQPEQRPGPSAQKIRQDQQTLDNFLKNG